MSIENVPINSGTGPKIAVDLVGTDNFQAVKIMQGTDGTTGGGFFTGTVSLSGTSNVSVVNMVTISGSATALPSGTQNVSVVNTPTVTATPTGTQDVNIVAGAAGNKEYTVDDTGLSTGTGIMFIGLDTDTARGVNVDGDGHLQVDVLSGGGGGQQYTHATTGLGATGTGTLFLGLQSTTAFSIAVTSSGELLVANVRTGTVDVVNTVTISGTATALPSGTQNVDVTNVISASGVTIASVTTGTMTALPTGTQDVNLVGQAGAVNVITTHDSTIWDSYAVNTTSGSSTIIETSGAHTIYVTDLMVSVDIPMRVDIFSAATTKASVYLATKGGFTLSLNNPMVLNSNQSLTFQGSVSGSASAFAAGYTVT